MRFKINLATCAQKRFLPFDYQYALSSAVYRIISKGDEAYSNFLHDQGFAAGRLKRIYRLQPQSDAQVISLVSALRRLPSFGGMPLRG